MSKKNIWEQIHNSKIWGHYPNEECVRFIARNFFKLSMKERNRFKILAVGCGQGANLWFLAKEGFDTYGIDISSSAIEKAELFLKESHGTKANLIVGTATKLPYENSFFDAVIDIVSLQHLTYSDHIIAYKEINRVLKKGKMFFTIHVAKDSFGYGLGNLIDQDTFDKIAEGPLSGTGQITLLDSSDLTKLLEESNIETLSIEKQINTFENQKKSLSHWIISARKK